LPSLSDRAKSTRDDGKGEGVDVNMDCEALQAFLAEAFPQVAGDFTVEEVRPMEVIVRLHVGQKNLRPGGTVSGPAMFSLADVAVYLAILAMIGPQALAVTTSCSIDFMRKPAADRDLLARARLLKLGRVLAVGDVLIFSEGAAEPVARASLTYSIPPRRA
jgi:uncharacterized protein (TIGR00369 family)